MVGLQPPSSTSSSRIRTRPPPNSSTMSTTQRTTIVTSNASNNRNNNNAVPLESVVIRNNNSAAPSPLKRGNGSSLSNNPASHNDNDNDGVKSTNVKVCVRLRPMLSSDFKTNAADNGFNGNGSGADPTIINDTPSKGRGFARETASSYRHSTLKKHGSGLVTPSKRNNNNNNHHADKQQQQAAASNNPMASSSNQTPNNNLLPSWQTYPQNPTRITQCTHTTSHTSHHNPERLADYSFDRVYAPEEPTNRLYEESIRGVVRSCVEGFHGSVFAYGQTNSGKTHTMAGSPREPGVVRLAVQDIFHRIRSQNNNSSSNNNSSREYLVRVSYLEIYNEQIYDLLALPQKPSPSKFKSSLQHHHLPPSTAVRIFESRTEGVVVRGLREEIVTSPEEVFALLDGGDARRRVGSTGMNKTSSRSHSVFRLVLESRASTGNNGTSSKSGSNNGGLPSLVPSSNSSVNSDTDSVATGRSSITPSLGTAVKGPVRISSLSLVDLAGSESVKMTGSTGVRQKEGQYINKSLLTLGHVVHKLSEMSVREKNNEGSVAPPKEHIPYRDSKLTRLLQPSLGGNAQVCIICNVSPALANLEESHNTLKFAMRAKKIQQHARITEVADEKTLLRSYREEIEELKRQLKEARKAADEMAKVQQEQSERRQVQRTPKISSGDESSSDEEEDQDDTHVLVSAIANLESLILKAGGVKSTQKMNVDDNNSNNAASETGNGGDESSLPSRALDAALMKAESGMEDSVRPEISSSPLPNAPGRSSSFITSTTHVKEGQDEEEDHNLLEELHRIQGMLGTVMMKKLNKGNSVTTSGINNSSKKSSNHSNLKTPERDAEVERLRMQLQEQEVATTMRKADSSFLQSQLNEKEGILKEVSVLLDALEKRQLELESENKQLRDDLADATNMIEEGNAKRKALEQKLMEKDELLLLEKEEKKEEKDIVFVERSDG